MAAAESTGNKQRGKNEKLGGGIFFLPQKGKLKAMKAEGRRRMVKRNGNRKKRMCV
jgi:hypothetical protein